MRLQTMIVSITHTIQILRLVFNHFKPVLTVAPSKVSWPDWPFMFGTSKFLCLDFLSSCDRTCIFIKRLNQKSCCYVELLERKAMFEVLDRVENFNVNKRFMTISFQIVAVEFSILTSSLISHKFVRSTSFEW